MTEPTEIKEGDAVVCVNGHVVGRVTKDLNLGDATGTWGNNFEWLQKDRPRIGETHVPKCDTCGAAFIKEGWRVLIMGWRP